MIRIIAGKYKSRRIAVPAKIRPTKDNVREAVFNIIAADLKDSRVLDLFSGSGAFGIEALSRGASYAVFVDDYRASIDCIKRNIQILDKEDASKARVIGKDVTAAVASLYRMKEVFDIIYLDPPYYKNLIRKCLKCLDIHDILTSSGLIVAEHSKKDELPHKTGRLELIRRLSYGDINISIYKKVEIASPLRGSQGRVKEVKDE